MSRPFAQDLLEAYLTVLGKTYETYQSLVGKLEQKGWQHHTTVLMNLEDCEGDYGDKLNLERFFEDKGYVVLNVPAINESNEVEGIELWVREAKDIEKPVPRFFPGPRFAASNL